MPAALTRVLAEQGGMRVRIVEGLHEQLTTLLRRGDLDLVVGRLPPRRVPPDLTQLVLGADRARLVVRAGHPLTTMGVGRLAQLEGWQWILPLPDTIMRRLIDNAFHRANLMPPVASVESMSFLTNRAMLLASDFISIWPQHLAEVETRTGAIATLSVDLSETERPMGVWWREDNGLTPAAQRIVAALREMFEAE